MIIPHVPHKTKLLNLVFSLYLILLYFLPSLGQTPQEIHSQLKSAVESGNQQAAMIALNGLRSSNSTSFTANNYDYLLGRLLEKQGDAAGASTNYHAVVARDSLLSQYAVWHLAELARSTGDLVLERENLRRLLNTSPASLLRDAATMRLGHSFFESQDYTATIATLRSIGENRNRSVAREALGLIAQAYTKAGKQQEARTTFLRLLMQMPDASRPDDFALAAVRGLDALDKGSSAEGNAGVAQLTEADYLLRASVYQFNRDFDAARLHYLALVARYPQSGTVANALYQTGRGYYQQYRYDDALKYFQRVVNEFPESTSARDALSFSAGAYNRLKQTDNALAAYRQFIERFPDAPNPERAWLNVIDTQHEAGRHKEALEWVQQTRAHFKGQAGDALAFFAQARIHLAQGDWQAVIADTGELGKFSDLGGTRVPGGTNLSELTFLRAYSLEQLSRTNEAISEYLAIPDGRNEYYGKRATLRLQAMGADARTSPLIQARAGALRAAAEKALNGGQAEECRRLAQNALRLLQGLKEAAAARDETLALVLRAYEALPAYKFPALKLWPLGRQEVITGKPQPTVSEPTHRVVAGELFFLGLYDEAVEEWAAGQSEMSKSVMREPLPRADPVREKEMRTAAQADLNYALAVYSLRGGLADRAVRFAEQAWKSVPGDYVLELAPRQMVDLLYPLPFRESLLKNALSRGVDPLFVTSIARQESRFQVDVKSVAAARGLMQFIPATASDTARELGLTGFDQDNLYNPDTAILFGSQYLAGLFKQFPGMPEAVAAAYNGGPDNVARWVARSRSNDPGRYVPEIGFSQTKDYVFRVMTNYWVYQNLYDEKLERK